MLGSPSNSSNLYSVSVLFVCQPFPMCELIRKSGQWNPGSRMMVQGVNAVVSEVPMPQFNCWMSVSHLGLSLKFIRVGGYYHCAIIHRLQSLVPLREENAKCNICGVSTPMFLGRRQLLAVFAVCCIHKLTCKWAVLEVNIFCTHLVWAISSRVANPACIMMGYE